MRFTASGTPLRKRLANKSCMTVEQQVWANTRTPTESSQIKIALSALKGAGAFRMCRRNTGVAAQRVEIQVLSWSDVIT